MVGWPAHRGVGVRDARSEMGGLAFVVMKGGRGGGRRCGQSWMHVWFGLWWVLGGGRVGFWELLVVV